MTTRDELAALMKDRLREVYMTATGEKYDAAFIMDDDPLNDVVVDGHVDFLDLASAILARWRLVPVDAIATLQRLRDEAWAQCDASWSEWANERANTYTRILNLIDSP